MLLTLGTWELPSTTLMLQEQWNTVVPRWLVLNKKRGGVLLNLSFYCNIIFEIHLYSLIQNLMGLVLYKGTGQKLFLFINDSCCCMTFTSPFKKKIRMLLIQIYMNFIITIFLFHITSNGRKCIFFFFFLVCLLLLEYKSTILDHLIPDANLQDN